MIIFKGKRFSLFSRGLRFFRELKKIEELPITKEEFQVFLLEPARRYHGESDSRFDKIEKQISKYYHSTDAPEFFGKVGSSFLLTWLQEHGFSGRPEAILSCNRLPEATDWVYDKIRHLPKRYLLDSLGCGMYGVCFDYPFGRIEKISFRGFTKEETRFYEYLLKNPRTGIFPKVYTLEKDQVVMEKLLTDHPKLKELNTYIDRYIISKFVGSNGLDGVYSEVRWEALDSDLDTDHWFRVLVYKVSEELKKIFGRATIGDFHTSNFGVRKETGEIVYFDPIGGKLLMS